jgi:SAM-dependent methyltransferase
MMVVSEEARSEGDKKKDLPELFVKSSLHDKTELDLVIGHDVWIGERTIILAGVSIGTGAVIAAGSVVTRDVKPYEIVGGVPAKHIRFRHEPDVIQALLESEWWALEPDEIWRRCGSLFYSKNVLGVLPLIARSSQDGESGELSKLETDLSNAPQILQKYSFDEMLELFTEQKYAHLGLPRWPSEDTQKRYTGGSGLPLMKRSQKFLEVLEAAGEFRNPSWRGLDFGVGWGRLASCMLRYGGPRQLDVCDAWDISLEFAEATRLRNKFYKVSEALDSSVLPSNEYDFVYAFSIFTHLNEATFKNNIVELTKALKSGGRLYFTVRHDDFLPRISHLLESNDVTAEKSPECLHVTYPNKTVYGETIVTEKFLQDNFSGVGSLKGFGLVDAWQHLYCLERKRG